MPSLEDEMLVKPAPGVKELSTELGEPPCPRSDGRRRSRIAELVRTHPALVGVLVAYAALAVFVVPTFAPVAISDDWVYSRAVERLVDDGVLQIPERAVANLVFQTLWGGLFASVLGMSFGVLRLSTVVLTLLSGAAVYGLARELGVDRNRSALGVAVYLFNPLSFVLAYSFMTDAVFAPLMVISAFFYVRGLRLGDDGWRATVAGSVVASCAFLVRQQGLLIPAAVLTFLLVTRRASFDRQGLRRLAHVALVPALTTVVFYLWLKYVHGVPGSQSQFSGAVRDAGWEEASLLVRRLTFIEVMYAGFFVLPIAAAALPRLVPLVRAITTRGWALLAALCAVLAVGLVVFSNGRMPYIPHFLPRSGPGPNDLVVARFDATGPRFYDLLTAACAVSALVFGVLLARAIGGRVSAARAGAGLLACVAAWQAIGTFPASFHFRNGMLPGVDGAGVSHPSLDRYLLPLLPLAVCLVLWSLRGIRASMPAAVALVAAIAVVSVGGTRDALVFQRETWTLAREARAAGVPLDKLDAGAAWAGYYMNDASLGSPLKTPNGPWWIQSWAPAIDSTYVIATVPLGGYEIVRARRYSSWLNDRPGTLYLQRRAGATGPL